ncbi:hypothetical protein BN3087_220016 [Sulfurovum sp. enrichment culture clone C5]|uniref:Uncharacterized protein n=1 Tax=Sulfurovum sp. enrichment culture clone C5 TaxID=497650 RepID=A0A0S4XLM5_9BACT|nr:hypothetical protein BN3087_220016 [Sulfurovum sp. enrichment culture clone C5]
MTVREKLDKTKADWHLRTDEELAMRLKTNKLNIDSWIKRNKLPEKWELKIGQMYEQHIYGHKNIQISGDMNIVGHNTNKKHNELFYLIENYATPRLIEEFTEKLLKIKEVVDG